MGAAEGGRSPGVNRRADGTAQTAPDKVVHWLPRIVSILFVAFLLVSRPTGAFGQAPSTRFAPERDLLSLRYDHAPDKDDGQSAAADRTILESLFGTDWMKRHIVAVCGAYGLNAGEFNAGSDRVMDVAWNGAGGWLAGHARRDEVIGELTRRWLETLEGGGDVWVKEGGWSDISAAVVRRIQQGAPGLKTVVRIHVVQHSRWNEEQTTPAALDFTRQNTHYVRIRDANAYLNVKGGDASFVETARRHPVFGVAWRPAFEYYDSADRLDFSDTGELMRILGLGEMGIDVVRERFLGAGRLVTPPR